MTAGEGRTASASARRHRCLAVCAPGIEAICAAELAELGVRIRRTLLGGVEFGATDRQLYAANLWSRTATRIVVRVAAFTASSFSQLASELTQVDWGRLIPNAATPTVRVSSTASRLYHTGAIAERVAALASPDAATRPNAGSPADQPDDNMTRDGDGPLIVVRLIHDRVMVSVDSSGAALYQRGWRLETAKAPLRETLAAALILASGWDRQSPLIDPLCGSGTIAIEAALLAAGRAPGAARRFAFMDWPSFAPGTWASVIGAPHPSEVRPSGPPPRVIATDRDAGAIRAAKANARRAGIDAHIDIHEGSLSETAPPSDTVGWLITNPPYGKRVAGGDLRDLYASIGSLATHRLRGWVVGLLAADDRLVGHTGLPFERRLETDNGGIAVRFVVADQRHG